MLKLTKDGKGVDHNQCDSSDASRLSFHCARTVQLAQHHTEAANHDDFSPLHSNQNTSSAHLPPLHLHTKHQQPDHPHAELFPELLSELFVAACFLLGSVCFLTTEWVTFGVWLFIIGSFQLLVKPAKKLYRSHTMAKVTKISTLKH